MEINEAEVPSLGDLSNDRPSMKMNTQPNAAPSVSGTNEIYADARQVTELVEKLAQVDPESIDVLQHFKDDPTSMPQTLYNELCIIANSTQTIRRIQYEPKQPTQAELDKAEREFETYLKEREANYPTVIPDPGMISVSNAVAIATARFAGYDKAQKPKVELDGEVYKVTLWKHRRPAASYTFFMAIVEIDAWTGKIGQIQITAD